MFWDPREQVQGRIFTCYNEPKTIVPQEREPGEETDLMSPLEYNEESGNRDPQITSRLCLIYVYINLYLCAYVRTY